jgi:hypothetical protein
MRYLYFRQNIGPVHGNVFILNLSYRNISLNKTRLAFKIFPSRKFAKLVSTS